jgi:hypothetical protein
MSLERVGGRWQGACYPFRRGLKSGITRVLWGKQGTLWCGLTNRGWGSRGGSVHGLQRLVWRGVIPFELREITATKKGFQLAFTKPIFAGSALPPSFAVKSWTYDHHKSYGCPPRDTRSHDVRSVGVHADGMTVEIEVADLELCRVFEIKCDGVLAASGKATLLHGVGWYTLNAAPE